MTNEITVRISNDPCHCGEAATQADLDRYTANLEAHLGEHFPALDISVEQRSVYKTEVSGDDHAACERVST